MSDQETGYRAYLLRLWRAERAGAEVWRASLQSPCSEERLLFASLEQLFTFLEQETGRCPAWTPPGDPPAGPGDRRSHTCEKVSG